jgi:hypothetical protein
VLWAGVRLKKALFDAYIGPGAGLTAIGTMFVVVAVALLAVVGFVWYPVTRLLRRRRRTKSAADRNAGVHSAAEQ